MRHVSCLRHEIRFVVVVKGSLWHICVCWLGNDWVALSCLHSTNIYSIRHTQLKRLMFIHAWGCLWFTSTCTCKHLLFFLFVKYEDPIWNSESLQYFLVNLLLVFSLLKVDEKRFPILIVRVWEVTSAAHTSIYAICISPLLVFSLLTRRKYQTSYKNQTMMSLECQALRVVSPHFLLLVWPFLHGGRR